MRERQQHGFIGGLSVAAGLAAAHLFAAPFSGVSDPVVSIGNRVIDHIPSALKSFAIRTFGVNDKSALVVTIYIALLGLSLWIGRSYFSDKERTSKSLIVLLTSIGVTAAIFDPDGALLAPIPSLIAGAVTYKTLTLFKKRLSPPERVTTEPDRREVLRLAGLVGAGIVGAIAFGKLIQKQTSAQLQRLNIVLPKPLKFLPAPPIDPALTTPGLSKLITPIKEFYRIDTAIVTPDIDVEKWTLRIDGMVAKPIELTYAQLTKRPIFELDDTIACVSNEVGGNLVGNARWLGIRLDDLIREASPTSRADQVMGYSVDGFSAGFPLAALDGRDAMIAIGMNGEALPIDHGFPARIIVPGLYGYVSATKWLKRIELTRFDLKEGYWVPRGWSVEAPIKTQSRIDTPSSDTAIKPGVRAIAGVAWAPTRGISKVEVRVDNGPWRDATLGPELANTTWRQWWIHWSAQSGEHILSVRATDGKGELQPANLVPPEPNGAEGWHTVSVTVRA